MWISPIRIRYRYSISLVRVGLTMKGRNFLFFLLLSFPPPIKKLPNPQVSLHKYWVLEIIYEMFMMWVGCWFSSNQKPGSPSLVRKPWTKHPPMVRMSSPGFVDKSFAHADCMGYGSLSCCWAFKPTLVNWEQTNHCGCRGTIPASLDSFGKIDTISQISSKWASLCLGSSKGRQRMQRVLWGHLAGQVGQKIK